MQVHIMAPGSTVNSLSVVRIWHYCVETVVSQEQVRARPRSRIVALCWQGRLA